MRIAIIPGDGIGPEVMDSALKVLENIGFNPEYLEVDVGYERWKREGKAIDKDDYEALRTCDAVLKGPVTTPPRSTETFESVTLRIRKNLDVFANVRPFKSLPVSPFKNVDLTIVRENTEGLYSGKETLSEGVAVTERIITEDASKRIFEYSFNLARKENRRKVTCVHKANIMKKTCGLFRDVFNKVSENYSDIVPDEKLVDACAYELVKNPQAFEILVTSNMFGDILSDEAAGLIGSLGLMGSINIGNENAVFEPIHGTAPDIAGKGKANPIGMMMATSYMLDYLDRIKEGNLIRKTIVNILEEGRVLTPDLGGTANNEKLTNTIISKMDRISL
jgi:isopropylmalate/isohomocitrate dehydrogenase-like protein